MRWAAGFVVVMALLAGCGGSEEAGRTSLAEIVPRDAAFYGEVVLRPSGKDGLALRRFAGNLLGIGTAGRDDLADLLVGQLGLAIDFEDDVAPWLGERAGFYLPANTADPAGGAVLVETTDPAGAARALRREIGEGDAPRPVPGGRFWEGLGRWVSGVIGGRVVFASSEAVFRATARAAEGGSLAETDRYREAAAPLNGRAPAAFVVAGRGDALRDLIRLGGGLSPRGVRLLRSAIDPSVALTVRADVTATDAVVEVLGLRAPGPTAPAIEGMPDAAWLATASGDLGEWLTTGLTAGGPAMALRRATLMPFPDRMLRALGRGSLYLQGGNGRRGSAGEIVAVVKDFAAVESSLRELARKLRRSGLYEVELHTYRGSVDLSAEWTYAAAPLDRIDIVLRRRELTVYFGATGSADSLGETRAYKRAARVLGGPPTTLLNMRRFIRALGGGDAGFAERFEVLAAQERRLPRGRLGARYMLGLREGPALEGAPAPIEPASARERSGAGGGRASGLHRAAGDIRRS